MSDLTAGEECQLSAKTFSTFVDARHGGAIPGHFIIASMGIAIVRGNTGVAVVRLKTGDWSAPCAIVIQNPNSTIQPGQETILLFTSERSILSLVAGSPLILGQTHRFLPGPLQNLPFDPSVDVYVYVRFNNGFTPQELIMSNMTGWGVAEDSLRHRRWHGGNVTWYDVLTNKISVDRSSIGNA
ncbi:hypothetical protein HK102_006009, partial [Quaeritorhiza haematococci]